MTEDRREEERKDITLEARWEGGSGIHPARISDLSLGGCYLDTLGGVEVDEVIAVEIKLPSGEWLQLRGEVASFIAGTGFGVLFSFLTDDEEQTLRELIT